MREEIKQYLSTFDLDIRKLKDARFMDQKCTPDVVCFIADCVINTIINNEEFTVNDIWTSQYFIKNARAVFNKPWADNPKAKSEYDKFIQQPLRMLAYAGILKREKKGTKNYYKIISTDILEYISRKERNTYNFLYCYLEKVLCDSHFYRNFRHYKLLGEQGCLDQNYFKELKTKFERFIIGHTSINKKTEVDRIFPKILNIYAVENQLPGSERGRLSRFKFTFSDLMYNKKNWRDLNKDKTVTRSEAENKTDERNQQEAFNKYYIQKATSLLRKIQIESEVKDSLMNGDATQVHHIFPKSQFPEIAHYLENLIKLTATQHNTRAHPNNNTQEISKDYQLTCLLSKSETIDKSLQERKEYYRKESFVKVINVGLSTNLSINLSFTDIKNNLIQIYNGI